MKNNILKHTLLTFMCIAFSLPALAGPNDPDDGGDPLPAPIDNWIILLILSAAAVGIYFIMKHNKKALA